MQTSNFLPLWVFCFVFICCCFVQFSHLKTSMSAKHIYMTEFLFCNGAVKFQFKTLNSYIMFQPKANLKLQTANASNDKKTFSISGCYCLNGIRGRKVFSVFLFFPHSPFVSSKGCTLGRTLINIFLPEAP